MFGKSKEIHEGMKSFIALDKTVSDSNLHTHNQWILPKHICIAIRHSSQLCVAFDCCTLSNKIISEQFSILNERCRGGHIDIQKFGYCETCEYFVILIM